MHEICSKNKCAQRIQLAVKNCVGLHFGLKTTFCQIISMSSYKMRFTWNFKVCLKNTTRCWKLCSTSFCVKNYLLPNYKHVLLRNKFCMKSAKLEGDLLRNAFSHEICSKNTTRCWKLCLTSFCVKNYLLPNYEHVLLRNKFCMKSAQRTQVVFKVLHEICFCWKLCFTSVWVKMFLFFKLEGYLAKKCVFHQMC